MKHLLTFAVMASVAHSGLASVHATLAGSGHISVENYASGDTTRCPVALIRGSLSDAAATSVTVINTSSQRRSRQMTGLAHNGNFKVLTELVPGSNELIIQAKDRELPFTLNYRPQTNPYVVRVFYLTDRTGNTDYQTPIENDPQDYRGKLETAMKLMQTFTAERMHDLGFGRVTFNLEFDSQGKVQVHKLQADAQAERYHKMDGLALWSYAAELVDRKMPNSKAKNLVIPAFTRFDPNTRQVYAHTALGGGSLALFGGGNLFAWPNSLADAQMAFMDARTIDESKFFSDSVARHTFWAAASTTIGAALHELGHTLDLPHGYDPQDIMTRGFDRFNRAFTVIEPPHAGRKEPCEFGQNEIALWAPPSAAWLRFSRWLALDERHFSDQSKTSITMDSVSRSIIIQSPSGVGAVVLTVKADARAVLPIDLNSPPPLQVTMKMDQFGEYLAADQSAIRVIDTQGLSSTIYTRELMPWSFVRSWQFAPAVATWDDPQSFVPIDPNRLKAIAASAASAGLSTSERPYVDFLSSFPSDKRENLAAYAIRTFVSDRPRDIRIFTGSDDALRVWLNGQLVTHVLALRPAAIDSESATARILKGENTLIAEVSQSTGGWGLYLRMDDGKGNDVIITDSGRIADHAAMIPPTDAP